MAITHVVASAEPTHAGVGALCKSTLASSPCSTHTQCSSPVSVQVGWLRKR